MTKRTISDICDEEVRVDADLSDIIWIGDARLQLLSDELEEAARTVADIRYELGRLLNEAKDAG